MSQVITYYLNFRDSVAEGSYSGFFVPPVPLGQWVSRGQWAPNNSLAHNVHLPGGWCWCFNRGDNSLFHLYCDKMHNPLPLPAILVVYSLCLKLSENDWTVDERTPPGPAHLPLLGLTIEV